VTVLFRPKVRKYNVEKLFNDYTSDSVNETNGYIDIALIAQLKT